MVNAFGYDEVLNADGTPHAVMEDRLSMMMTTIFGSDLSKNIF